MKDKLEEFIREHKEEFDLLTPPDKLWKSIEKKQNKGKIPFLRLNYAAAAAVLLIIVSFIWFMKPQQVIVLQPEKEIALNPELKNAETYYASIVETRRAEVGQLGKDYPELCNDLDKELNSLDTLYTQLKIEYSNTNGNEAVMQAMVENLQTRVQLLARQLEIIQNIRQKSNKNQKVLKSI
jgi:hypothetical protein